MMKINWNEMKAGAVATALVMSFMVFCQIAQAQMEYVSSALDVINNNYEEDLAETIQDLEKCLEDPTTQNAPKMWYARARIYQMVAMSEDTAITKLAPDAAYISLKAYTKFFPNPGKRKQYKEGALNNLFYSAYGAYNRAVVLGNSGQVDEAIKNINMIKEVIPLDEYEYIETSAKITGNKLDLLGYDICQRGGAKYRSKAKAYLQGLIDKTYMDPNIYIYMADLLMEEGDTNSAIKYIEDGKELYDDNDDLVRKEINIYIMTKQTDKLFSRVNESIKLDPTNSKLYGIRGTLYNQMDSLDQAMKDFDEALKYDPGNFDVKWRLAAIYVDQANPILDRMVKLVGDMEAYNRENEKVKALYNKAVPMLEEVLDNMELSNQERYNLLKDVRNIYRKLKNKEKADYYSEQMKELLE
jgi:tetratricopeptide (TPR) repeat protein